MRTFAAAILVFISGVGPAVAQEEAGAGLCGKVLSAALALADRGDNVAIEYLRANTTLLNLMFGAVSPDDPNAPYKLFYEIDGTPPERSLDFRTQGADRLDGCIRVDGRFQTADRDVGDEIVRLGNDRDLRVSVFAFDRGSFEREATSGKGYAATNVRVKFGKLGLRYFTSEPPTQGIDDPFDQFALSTYLYENGQARLDTYVGSAAPGGKVRDAADGQHLWLAREVGQDTDLTLVVCSPACADFQDGGTTAEVSEPPAAVVANESLKLTITASGGSFVDQIAVQALSDQQKSELFTLLRTLDSNPATKIEVLERLVEWELLASDEEWVLTDYEVQHALALERVARERLTGIVLEFGGAENEILRDCRPVVSISQPDRDPIDRVFALEGDIPFSRFGVRFGEPEAGLLEPIGDLEVHVTVDPRPDGADTTCRVTLGSRFPDNRYHLTTEGATAGYMMTDDGVAVFTDVSLSSTRPPTYLVLYNVRGHENQNGELLAPDDYPDWNGRQRSVEFEEALGILAGAADEAYAPVSGGVFIVEAAGGNRTSFETAQRLSAGDRRSVQARVGQIGTESLVGAIRDAVVSNELAPRFVVIGRTGLRQGSYDCTPPDVAGAVRDLVLIDFVPRASYDALPAQIRDALNHPPGPEEFARAVSGFGAVRCPNNETDGIEHWLLLPDFKSGITWRENLRVLARTIFAGGA